MNCPRCGNDDPETLDDASRARKETVYRCDKCGYIYAQPEMTKVACSVCGDLREEFSIPIDGVIACSECCDGMISKYMKENGKTDIGISDLKKIFGIEKEKTGSLENWI